MPRADNSIELIRAGEARVMSHLNVETIPYSVEGQISICIFHRFSTMAIIHIEHLLNPLHHHPSHQFSCPNPVNHPLDNCLIPGNDTFRLCNAIKKASFSSPCHNSKASMTSSKRIHNDSFLRIDCACKAFHFLKHALASSVKSPTITWQAGNNGRSCVAGDSMAKS